MASNTILAQSNTKPEDFKADYQNLPAERKQCISALKEKLNYTDAATVAVYGMDAQKRIANVTDKMLANIRTSDAEEALGSTIGQLTKEMRAVDLSKLGSGRGKGVFSKFFGFFKDKVETLEIDNKTVAENISAIEQNLLMQARTYQNDIETLGHMYEEAEDYYLSLEDHIIAALQAREEFTTKVLPALEQEVHENDSIVKLNELRDVKMNLSHMDSRIREMMAARSVIAAQGDTLRMQQQNCKELIAKINDAVTTALPIWKMQINSAITASKQKKGVDALNALSSFIKTEIEAQSAIVKDTTIKVMEGANKTIIQNESIALLLSDINDVYNAQRRISEESKNLLSQQIKTSQQHEEQMRQIITGQSAKPKQIWLEK